ncbi:hypothetical protein SHA02_12190 [Salisediminibacterium halotolerans]|nr:hypothetical protein SHA02_12190 [Salisediminibacterium halotolerans]
MNIRKILYIKLSDNYNEITSGEKGRSFGGEVQRVWQISSIDCLDAENERGWSHG